MHWRCTRWREKADKPPGDTVDGGAPSGFRCTKWERFGDGGAFGQPSCRSAICNGGTDLRHRDYEIEIDPATRYTPAGNRAQPHRCANRSTLQSRQAGVGFMPLRMAAKGWGVGWRLGCDLLPQIAGATRWRLPVNQQETETMNEPDRNRTNDRSLADPTTEDPRC
jgi:hypothetical protein